MQISSKNLAATIPLENEIILKKYLSKQIGKMSPSELSIWGQTLLLKIHVITGWTIPSSDLLVILVDQFQKKLVESYPDMNVDEIEYAFRHSGTTVQDWGKQMNLNLIDQVLIPYLLERQRISHAVEERMFEPPVQKIYTEEEIDNICREDLEMFYQRCRNGRVPEKTPEYFKDILVKDGLMKPEDNLVAFFVTRLNNGSKNIYIKS